MDVIDPSEPLIDPDANISPVVVILSWTSKLPEIELYPTLIPSLLNVWEYQRYRHY